MKWALLSSNGFGFLRVQRLILMVYYTNKFGYQKWSTYYRVVLQILLDHLILSTARYQWRLRNYYAEKRLISSCSIFLYYLQFLGQDRWVRDSNLHWILVWSLNSPCKYFIFFDYFSLYPFCLFFICFDLPLSYLCNFLGFLKLSNVEFVFSGNSLY